MIDKYLGNHRLLWGELTNPGEKTEALLANQILAPQDRNDSDFWEKVISRWGQGSGYKLDVLSVYNQQLVRFTRDGKVTKVG